MKQRTLMLQQLDHLFEAWQGPKAFALPKDGWVKTMRKALGMTITQLAKRAGINRARIIKIEKAESLGAVTLKTLSSLANHLECDLVYALVPKSPLKNTLRHQATQVAQKKLQYIAHSMALENQSVSKSQLDSQLTTLIEVLLKGSPKHLWEE